MPERGVYFANAPLTDVEFRSPQFRLILEYSEPIFDALQSFHDFTENISEKPVTALSTPLIEECTFRWQQKLHFAENKFNTVPKSQIEGCAREDREDIMSQKEVATRTKKRGNRVFTLIDGEEPTGTSYSIRGNELANMKFNPSIGEKSLAGRIAMTRNRRVEPTRMSHRKLIIDLPYKKHLMKTTHVQRNQQIMYIMAYLGPVPDNTQVYDESNQYVLCKMTAINGTNIIIEPDLFSISKTIESRYGTYKARLSIVSNEKFDRVGDFSTDQLWFEKEESSAMSDFPCEKTTTLVYLIDIERAVNFPHDGLCIEYNIDLPLQCVLIDLSPARTWPTAVNSSPQKEDDVAVFSQPVCVTLIIKEEEQLLESFDWPRMIFRLCREDYWGRSYVNGFGQLTLPSRPGRHLLDVKCWRYERYDRKGMLFENFISDMAAELTFASEPAIYEAGSIASSIGLNVVSSGILKTNVQCIMQCREFVSDAFSYEMKYRILTRHDGMQSQIHWNILKVLSKFEEARRNLLKIRNQPIPIVSNKVS